LIFIPVIVNLKIYDKVADGQTKVAVPTSSTLLKIYHLRYGK
jgi:hypothetical protein